ncbi:MAG: hypothetical protein P8170_18170 [Gemmatimonadota bacterium]
MRFAYIDPQGNEVNIPSVEALALRIELGAIGPETQLFDAHSDRWGPARTHEIYQALARSAGELADFVTPSPPAEPTGGDDAGLDLDLVPVEPTPGPKTPAPSQPPTEATGEVLDLTLAEENVDPLASAPPPSPGNSSTEGLGAEEGSGADVSPGVGLEGLELAPTFPAHPGDSLGAGYAPPLDLETPLDAMDFTASPAPEPPPGEQVGETLPAAPGPFLGDEPPAWREQTPPERQPGEPPMSFSRTRPTREQEPEASAFGATPVPRPGERAKPPPRPAPPRRARRSVLRGPGLLLVAVGVVAVVGYYGWGLVNLLADRRAAASRPPSVPSVVLPDIPVELEPRMRELGEAAVDRTLAVLSDLPGELGLAEEPREDWLAGVYLANAGDFTDVEDYWLGIEELVDRARDTDSQLFHQAYVEQLAAADLSGDTADMLLERADSGFLATRPERFEAYALMDDLVNASLDLHVFLVERQDSIAYEPARGGMSRDPVLEAVPTTPALGERMWEGVNRITESLDALGTLDRVTTDRLVTVLVDRLREAGFR